MNTPQYLFTFHQQLKSTTERHCWVYCIELWTLCIAHGLKFTQLELSTPGGITGTGSKALLGWLQDWIFRSAPLKCSVWRPLLAGSCHTKDCCAPAPSESTHCAAVLAQLLLLLQLLLVSLEQQRELGFCDQAKHKEWGLSTFESYCQLFLILT